MYSLLIVDDELWIRKGLINTVNWRELNIAPVHEAEDASQALKMMTGMQYDIVVTDIRMGIVSGLEMIEMARQSPKQPQFIIISGYQNFEYAQEAIELDICAYIVKPIDEQKFMAAVRKAIGRIEEQKGRGEAASPAEQDPQPSTAPRLIITQVIEYITMNYHEPIGLSSAAKYVHLNESYLSKLFFKEIGMTFTKYLMKKRISAAKELLADPRNKVYEIGERIGYPDVKYFTKVFKELEGTTPTEYREGLAANCTK